MDRGNEADEQRDDAAHLEHIVDGGERPVVLGGEDEVDEEHTDESENRAGDEQLHRQTSRERGAVLEDRVVRVTPKNGGQ